ncbi:hypothetical protein FB645_005545 [Coemansia sp. IMI 203386]|nr:hypothetical protein FB645_005545 [Coemansia sp. IMI 203386]
MPFTILEIVQQCNSVAGAEFVVETEGHYQFKHESRLVGLVSAADITALEKACAEHSQGAVFDIDHSRKTIRFSETLKNSQSRSQAVAELLAEMRTKQSWKSLSKWRDELYPIYGDSGAVVAMVERAASCNFGLRTFGVHINGIVKDNGETRMWVARRAPTKQTWPGYLDQVVAGGIGDGMGVRDSVIKECAEEGGIPEELAQRARCAGTIQYFTRSELGLQPETQYVYDLELPLDFVPKPTDGEVQEFYLWTLDEVIDRVRQGLFKPNCALCVVDFLIRLGYLTPENEPDYLAIIDNIHCALPFPGPST